MAEITASLVKELRDKTGVGMMDCKKALSETNGDFQAAEKYLREKGLSAASKKSDRATAEGRVFISNTDDVSVIVEVNCETDFVASNDDFNAFGNSISNAILNSDAKTTDDLSQLSIDSKSFEQYVSDHVLKLGENISVKQFTRIQAPFISTYVHMNGKIGVVTGFSGEVSTETGKDISMHIAAANPEFLNRDSVDASRLEEERQIIRTQVLNEGKPEQIVDKIVDGKINKYYKENCLLEQDFVKDPDKQIQNVLPEGKTIESFIRYQV